ncbi:phytochromobilin:ferredoxin oxidoreductase, chloroplastic [Quillaja saponaria]|uniref:Phytochromobilin:ferredoxin oxidoreductase, chloroplastic n=1 Tax=Quillaja saponaria TaxID=32244 RepID=A0AAD7PQG4_QUISA|nr:phytochromobilin:ferredoxin oxidoreductase, chloroplastic [Quillaja saponaria]
MELGCSSSFHSQLKPLPLTGTCTSISRSCRWRLKSTFKQISAISYHKFIDFALDETRRHTDLVPSPIQEKFKSMNSKDGKTELQTLSFQAPKIRLFRSLSIETEDIQVLDFAVFPEPEFDVPIFCANFFTSNRTNIVVLDLNPLHDVIHQNEYKEKYFKSLLPLGLMYSELLPWGGKLTGESIKFFSPIVIWTRFSSSQHKYDVLYSAFRDYYKEWLELIGRAAEETDARQIFKNREAQHRYLTWRAEKDPGQALLKKLIGDTLAKDLVRNFLFNGIDELGTRKFLDYFPEYGYEDGTINEKRSIIGKSFESRPWNAKGEFIGDIC